MSRPDGEQQMRLSDVNREGVRAMAMGYLDACMVGSDERK